MGAELKEQVVCSLKTRRASKHGAMDFRPIMERASSMVPLSIVVAGKGYDSEDGEANHEFVRKEPDAVSIIIARYEDVPV